MSQVLRFSRLFKPAYTSNIWKRKKKKKPEEEGKGKPDEVQVKEEGEEHIEGVKQEAEEEGEEEVEEYCIKLNMGREPLPEEMGEDQSVSGNSLYKDKFSSS